MKPHHPTPEAIELTEGEKDKIMNDFLLPNSLTDLKVRGLTDIHSNTISNDLSTKTLDELISFQLALTVAYELSWHDKATAVTLKELYSIIERAIKDLEFEGQQLPY